MKNPNSGIIMNKRTDQINGGQGGVVIRQSILVIDYLVMK